MPTVGFEPTISAGERPQTYALDRAATGTGKPLLTYLITPCNRVLPGKLRVPKPVKKFPAFYGT